MSLLQLQRNIQRLRPFRTSRYVHTEILQYKRGGKWGGQGGEGIKTYSGALQILLNKITVDNYKNNIQVTSFGNPMLQPQSAPDPGRIECNQQIELINHRTLIVLLLTI